MSLNFVSQNTSTMSEPSCILLTLAPDEHGYIVHDCVGTVYGWGKTPKRALRDWADGLSEFCDLVDSHDCAAGLRIERARYAAALRAVGPDTPEATE